MLRPGLGASLLTALVKGAVRGPGWFRRILAGPARQNDRGQVLDPETQVLLRLISMVGAGPKTLEAGARRLQMRASVSMSQGPAPACEVVDTAFEGASGPIPVRVLVPPDAGSIPMLVYFHGGGWMVGDLDTHEVFARRLAVEGRRIIACVDYRLAPEHPFPAGFDDAVAAFREAQARASEWGADTKRVGIGGDSAGANLAAAACGLLDTRRPDLQLLVNPSVDLRCQSDSMETLGQGYFLERGTIDWFIEQYGAPLEDPRGSPLLRPSFAGDPPAIVVIAGFDPLRDEGERYVEALRADGVTVQVIHVEGLIHGFQNMAGLLQSADRAVSDVATALRSWS